MICLQLKEMLRVNIRQNLRAVIQIATKYSDILGPVKLIEMFESFKTLGTYKLLHKLVNYARLSESAEKQFLQSRKSQEFSQGGQTCRSTPIDHCL